MAVQQATTGAVSVPKNNRRWLPVGVLSVAFLVDQSENISLSVLWPQMYRTLGASIGQLGTVLAISQLVNTLTLPLWGYAVDRFSRKWLLVWFTGFWGLWTCAIGLVETLPQLVLVRALSALGLGVFIPAAFSLIGDLFDSQSRGRATGTMRALGLTGTLVAFGGLPVLAGRDPEAWRWGFVGLGGLSFFSGLIMLSIREPTRGAAEPELRGLVTDESARRFRFKWRDLSTIARVPSWRWIILKDVLDGISLAVFFRWGFPWLDELGLGQAAIFVIVMIFVGVIAGNALFGWLGDWLDRRYRQRGRLMLVLVAIFIQLPSALLAFNSSREHLGWLIAMNVLLALAIAAGSESVRWPIAHAVLPPELRGSGQAFVAMTTGFSSAIVLVISGILADQVGIGAMLLRIVPLPILVSILPWLMLFRTYPVDRATLQQSLIERRADLLGRG